MDEPLEVSVDIDAPPEVVWAMVSDLTRMGEWSPECRGVAWRGGTRGPVVGARFRGRNRIGWRRWSTDGVVVAAEPGRELVWDISALGLSGARWGYRLEPRGDGCRVVESCQDRRGRLLTVMGRLTTGVADRRRHNEEGMRATLQRLKEAAEAAATGRVS